MIDQKPVLSRLWVGVYILLLTFFAFTRFSDLTSRPLHHDEGVNGVFLKGLVTANDWKYDPENYHGPSLYYLQVIPTWISSYLRERSMASLHGIAGLTAASVRSMVALAGMVLLVGIIAMHPMIGRWGAFIAFLLAGFSADLLFFSRYFIHETYVVLFTFGVVFGIHRYYLTQRRRFAYVTVLSAALLFCTKETSLIHLAILGLAWLCAETTQWLVDGRKEAPPFERIAREPGRVYAELGLHGPAALVLGVIVWALLFSSMFNNPRGLIDSLRTYFFWGGEGFESGHVKPFFYYLSDILIRYETPLVVLTVIGLVAAFARNERTGLFLAYWTLGTVAVYSLIPYKTPWLVENFIVPMALLSGYGVQTLASTAIDRLKNLRGVAAVTVLVVSVIFISAAQIPQTFRLAYQEYDDERHPQIYAHTVRGIYDLLARVDAAAVRSGLGRKMTINIFSDEYWPLPFYMAKYDASLFWGKLEGTENVDAPVIIALPRQREQLDGMLRQTYAVTSHDLRPGVPLLLYINTQLVQGQEPLAVPIDLPNAVKAPEGLSGGLHLEVYNDPSFATEPFKSAHGDAGWDFNWEDDSQKHYQSPFALRWSGYIKIDKAGMYKFSLESDDGSWLLIDGETVINNGGDHAPIKLSRDANLSAGYHRIEVRYNDSVGGAVLRFSWTPPGGKEETVPFSVVFEKVSLPAR